MMFRCAFVVAAFLFVAACGGDRTIEPVFHEDDNPNLLSDWGVLSTSTNALHLSNGVTPYDLATPLFSDYASKLRTVWTPEGATATYKEDETFDFPIGTIITKTFYYSVADGEWAGVVEQTPAPSLKGDTLALEGIRLIETRLLVRRESGWAALPYVWNEDQTDAVLKRTGAVLPLTLARNDARREEFAYLVPNANQCSGCHATNATTKAIEPIGLKARHLNKPYAFGGDENQLEFMHAAGWLSGEFDPMSAPRNVDASDPSAPLTARARAYLDINCSHCHNPRGAADTSGLNLEPDADGPAIGLCKVAIAAGPGSGGRPYGIVPGAPDQSITIFRMETNDPGAMMPELGRAVTHEEGVAVVAAWIDAMEGDCS